MRHSACHHKNKPKGKKEHHHKQACIENSSSRMNQPRTHTNPQPYEATDDRRSNVVDISQLKPQNTFHESPAGWPEGKDNFIRRHCSLEPRMELMFQQQQEDALSPLSPMSPYCQQDGIFDIVLENDDGDYDWIDLEQEQQETTITSSSPKQDGTSIDLDEAMKRCKEAAYAATILQNRAHLHAQNGDQQKAGQVFLMAQNLLAAIEVNVSSINELASDRVSFPTVSPVPSPEESEDNMERGDI